MSLLFLYVSLVRLVSIKMRLFHFPKTALVIGGGSLPFVNARKVIINSTFPHFRLNRSLFGRSLPDAATCRRLARNRMAFNERTAIMRRAVKRMGRAETAFQRVTENFQNALRAVFILAR